MPVFPDSESATVNLADIAANGMKGNPTEFPNPPKDPNGILTDLNAYRAKQNEIQATEALKRLKVQEKNEIYGRIRSGTRDNIDYADIVADGNAAILDLVGWGNRAPSQRLTPPGQCRILEIIGQGDAWVRLDWKEPLDGGEVASYIVRRSEDGINFTDAGTVTVSDAALFDQPTGKKLIYTVVALNRAGEGVPSNTVTIVF